MFLRGQALPIKTVKLANCLYCQTCHLITFKNQAAIYLLVIYCVFLKAGTNSGLKSLSRLEYDTEQQVIGNHLLCAWETLEETHESSRKAHTRFSV